MKVSLREAQGADQLLFILILFYFISRFYDTIYTERYMGINSTQENYMSSDVSTEEHIKVLGQHDFLLIHGNADDNVHYQQSMVLARALERADIMFEQLSYPDEAHGISGPQRHLYHSMDRFWDKCFKY